MFILASASEARRKLLRGYRFKVVPSGVREVRRRTLKDTVLANARKKADVVAVKFPDTWVLAADTSIEFGGRIYGKPSGRKAALALLTRLAGQTHVLATAVVLQKNQFRIVRYVESRVTLKADPPLRKILKKTDPARFAGGYAIREKNDPLVERVDGSVTNVIGLPMEAVKPLLENLQVAKEGPETVTKVIRRGMEPNV